MSAVPGTVVPSGSLISPAGDQGPVGAQGPAGPSTVSTDPGNIATLGTDSKILVPQSQITAIRLRTYNALGNSTFECDQRQNASPGMTNPAGGIFPVDRWYYQKSAGVTAAINIANSVSSVVVPGTNFRISRLPLRFTVTTTQASLPATDFVMITQFVEGPQIRESINDVTSISVLAQCSIAPLSFGITISDSPATKCFTHLCQISTANTWTYITCPNIPVFPSGNFTDAPGTVGQLIRIVLGAGSTNTSPANDVWNTGTYYAATGQTNFAGQASAVLTLGFLQWEPGPVCTTPIDLPFDQNLWACERYCTKSYDYGVRPGTVVTAGRIQGVAGAGGSPNCIPVFFKKRMAKAPTIAGYSDVSGAGGNIRDESAGIDRAITAVAPNPPGESGFHGFNCSTQNAAIAVYSFHYVADTGW